MEWRGAPWMLYSCIYYLQTQASHLQEEHFGLHSKVHKDESTAAARERELDPQRPRTRPRPGNL